jgi:hypothetical protein
VLELVSSFGEGGAKKTAESLFFRSLQPQSTMNHFFEPPKNGPKAPQRQRQNNK